MDYQELSEFSDESLEVMNGVRQVFDATLNEIGDLTEDLSILHTDVELRVLYDVAAGLYDDRKTRGYIVHCGTFRGGSACVMASALKKRNSDYFPVVTIDSYSKYYEPWKDVFDKAYIEARENIWKLGLENHVHQVVADDIQFLSNFWNRPIRVAVIDTTHKYQQTVQEMRLLETHVVDNGWLIFDDCFNYKVYQHPGVMHAAEELLESISREVDVYRADKLLLLRLKG